MPDFQTKLKQLRIESGITQKQLAEVYGVSRARMNIILNSQQLTPACIGRLAEALSVPVESIIED